MSTELRLDIDATMSGALGGHAVDLGDLDSVRLILAGNSVIDWNRAHFETLADVDRFLALHLLDLKDPEDHRRLRFVHAEAVNYLEEHLGLTFPEDLRQPDDVREIFRHASRTGGFRRRQILACVILKLMHVINHMEAAELRFQTPLGQADVLDLAERRIVDAADRMRAEGFPLVAFYGSRKTRNSVITKLIAKKENTAATIFDKLRFRIVTEDRQHVLPAIAWLTRHLFPFNYVIPGQSHNNLVDLAELLNAAPYASLAEGLQLPEPALDGLGNYPTADENPFSGPGYRMVNFIVDFPVRVDHLTNIRYGAMLGRTVFAMVEFQVLDRATARRNEEGENAHQLYKERQRSIVEQRLKKGARWRRSRKNGPE
ncbi:MAG: TIGR04552 family protein [Myxococcota bacterium]|nr:TIGR04552 family protein [Myxococcota bacterium]